jgi:hypothetical protein
LASEQRLYRTSCADTSSPLRQVEIVSHLIQLHLDLSSLGASAPILVPKLHPFAVILRQDCDLEQDYRARHDQNRPDKMVPNVLFCEVPTAQGIRTVGSVNSGMWSKIKVNKDERYQFLQGIESSDDVLGQGLPELCIDFKRFFTIPTDEVYKRIEIGEAKRRCVLVSPYLEHLSNRFAYFLARIALPVEHFTE